VLDFLNFEIFDPSINTTLITLIPKTTSASSVSEFKPISIRSSLVFVFKTFTQTA
jgi:hypothetical protein